jgi:hypothetical protein
MRRVSIGRSVLRVIKLLLVLSVWVLGSCWFFPSQDKYYRIRYLQDELQWFSFTYTAIDARGYIYFANDCDSTVRRWSESSGLEDYMSFAGSVKAMEIDETGSKMYVLEGGVPYGSTTNLQEIDLVQRTAVQRFQAGDDCRAIGMAGDYLVVGPGLSWPPQYSLIKRSDYSVKDTISLDAVIFDYLFVGQQGKLLATAGQWGYNETLVVIGIDEEQAQFTGHQELDYGIPDPVLLLPDEATILMSDGSLMQTIDDNLSYVGALSDGDGQASVADACIFHNTLLTMDIPYTSGASVRIRSIIPPYAELKPSVQLDSDGRRLLVHGDSLFLLAENWSSDQIEIYKFDASICN